MKKKIFGLVLVLVILATAFAGCIDFGEKVKEQQEKQEAMTTDSDGDGVPDYYEDQYGWNKNNPDTDGDGVNDGGDIDPLVDVIVTIKFTYFKAVSGADWSYDDFFTECDSYFVVDANGYINENTFTTIDTWTSSVVDDKNEVTTVRTWEYNVNDKYSVLPTFSIYAYDEDTVPPDDQLDIGDDITFMLFGTYFMYKTSFNTPITTTISGSEATVTYEVTANNVS